MTLDRATVLAALRAEDLVAHYQIPGQWRGRWLRSMRCAVMDHSAEAFGISRDGRWHCWSCDQGGDMLRLVAVGEKLDMRSDFPRILEIAGKIAGVEDDESFGGSPPAPKKERPPVPPIPPLHERIATAKKRAAWVWDRLVAPEETTRATDMYLGARHLDYIGIRKLEDLRETPMRCRPDEWAGKPDLKSLSYLFAVPGVAIPVRAVDDGRLVDIRSRRMAPREDQPKIIGMLGGVTVGGAEAGRTRTLVGCYGRPHCIDPGPSRTVICCEGAMDYLTGLCLWPEAQILGAVDAGSLALVVGHAARQLVSYPGGRLIIVEQNDGAGAAADRSVNEDPNAATKVAVRILGPKRVGWLFCDLKENLVAGQVGVTCKDLNDLVRIGADPRKMVRWWSDMEHSA